MINEERKIGVLTWHYYLNYGSMLQTYALVRTLRSLGFNARVLNYHNPKFGKVSKVKNLIKKTIGLIPRKFLISSLNKIYFPKDRFRKFFKETSLVYSAEELKTQAAKFDTIICGSDQIWAPNVFNPIYFLNFVSDKQKKISYAASIGLNNVPDNLTKEYSKLLKRFDYISVRESKGKEIIKEISGRNAEVVLDPTLLVESKCWSTLAIKPKIQNPYIFCYFLKKDHKYRDAVYQFAKTKGYNVIGLSASINDTDWMEVLDDKTIGPREFLGLIKNAEVVCTDSYHGTIFSLLFHRPFITLERFSKNDYICQNSRLDQLIDYFSIRDSIVKCTSDTVLELSIPDWNKFETTLANLRKSSIEFIEKSLS